MELKIEFILLIRLLILVFMAILFLQSGLDKLLNFKSNLAWLKDYFQHTFFKHQVTALLVVLTGLESLTGVLCLLGIFYYNQVDNSVALLGLLCGAISFLSLFAGQRMAKDYPGAAGIPAYFIVLLIGLFTFAG